MSERTRALIGVVLIAILIYCVFQAYEYGAATHPKVQEQASAQVTPSQEHLPPPTVAQLQPKTPAVIQITDCIAQANINYPIEWANACYTSYTGLARFLENCQLPQNIENQVDQERLDAIDQCNNQKH